MTPNVNLGSAGSFSNYPSIAVDGFRYTGLLSISTDSFQTVTVADVSSEDQRVADCDRE